jgi:uncharacterized membrane protein YoaK (UPF0700 family)
MDETPAREESGPAAQAAGAPAAEPDDAHSDAQPDSTAHPDSGTQPDGGADSARKKDSGATPTASALTTVAVLLTIGTAGTDVISFTKLGSVFASVMTSNIVLLGLAAARQSSTLAWHAAVSFAGYVLGVATASRLVRMGRRRAGDQGSGHEEKPWSPWITATLIAELGVFVAFTVGWEITGTKPTGAAQLILLAVATFAMGMQSAVVVAMGIAGVTTTYMTGTLTTLIETIASPDRRNGTDARRPIVLLALVAGAGLSGLLIATVPSAVPAIPLAMLIGVVVIGTGPVRVDRGNR